MKRLKLCIDRDSWIFPLAFRLTCCGNNHRPYTFSIDLLCFRLIFCIDEGFPLQRFYIQNLIGVQEIGLSVFLGANLHIQHTHHCDHFLNVPRQPRGVDGYGCIRILIIDVDINLRLFQSFFPVCGYKQGNGQDRVDCHNNSSVQF